MTSAIDSDLEYVRKIIINHPFFSGLRLRFVPFLTDCASLIRVGMQETIFREGQDPTHLYLLHMGRVVLEAFVPREGTTTVQTVEVGEALGLSWLFPPYQWQFSGRAIEPCELVALDSTKLRAKAQENPDFGYDLLTRMSQLMWQRLQNTRRRLVELYVA